MRGNQFEWLLASVEVSSPAPEAWRTKHVLPFWEDPNHDAWGRDLSRYLMHESIHFWQLLSSSYLLERLMSEWISFLAYRRSGIIEDDPADLRPLNACEPGEPFSAFELMECWARFLDIHTRSPAVIIDEEGHQGPPGKALLTEDPSTGRASYTQFGFDWLMQRGPDAAIYVKPYRWLLDALNGNSKAAVACFPIVVQIAFATPAPVKLFCAAVDAVDQSPRFRDFIALQFPQYALINSLWFEVWKTVVNETIACGDALELPRAWGIDQPGLYQLPAYEMLPDRFTFLQEVLQHAAKAEPQVAQQREVEFATATKHGVFALPGLPLIRRILGNYLPPSRIRFANFDWYPDMSVPGALGRMERDLSGSTDRDRIEALDDDVEAFREAQWMAREGLTVDAPSAGT